MSNQRESDEVTVRVIVKYDGKAAEKEMPYNDVPYEHSLTTISRDLLNSIPEEKWGVKYE